MSIFFRRIRTPLSYIPDKQLVLYTSGKSNFSRAALCISPWTTHLHRYILPLHSPYVPVHQNILLVLIYQTFDPVSDIFKPLDPFIPNLKNLPFHSIRSNRIPRQISATRSSRHTVPDHRREYLIQPQLRYFFFQPLRLALCSLIFPQILFSGLEHTLVCSVLTPYMGFLHFHIYSIVIKRKKEVYFYERHETFNRYLCYHLLNPFCHTCVSSIR